MKAVNLIPPEDRRATPGGPGRSGGAVYILLGVLGLLVVAVVAWVLTGNSITDKKAEIARTASETTAAEAQAAALKPYREFAALRQTRTATVASLARSRFDWERTMHQLSIVLPDDVWLTSLVGTVAPGVAFSSGGGGGSGGGGSSTSSLRSSAQVPAIELVGCTVDQAEVSRVMVRLRQMTGVTRVALAASEKADNANSGRSDSSASSASAGGGGGGGGDSDCRHGSSRFPQFQMVVFFDRLAVAAPGAGATPPASSAQKAQTAVATGGGK
jgi:Tfp pilus assembly protein PilN